MGKAFAHEAYVLTKAEFQKGLAINTINPLAPLFDPSHIKISAIITISVMAAYFLVNLWSITSWAEFLDKSIRKMALFGPLIIRLVIASSFFEAAMYNCIFGPELSLTQVPGGNIIRFILFALSIMISIGFFTEFAASVGLLLFLYAASVFGSYMITYSNYLGELIVLTFFGSRFLSVDSVILPALRRRNYSYLEIPIVRMLYGIALMYAGWTIKFSHQSLSVDVYNQYHLVNYFHAAAPFIAAGAGLSEILIGFFIFIGFTQRFTIIISLIFITASLLYFREMLWPHLMLYGISFSLFINSADKFSVDHYLNALSKNILGLNGKKKKRNKK